jgi:hypothetical protein
MTIPRKMLREREPKDPTPSKRIKGNGYSQGLEYVNLQDARYYIQEKDTSMIIRMEQRFRLGNFEKRIQEKRRGWWKNFGQRRKRPKTTLVQGSGQVK